MDERTKKEFSPHLKRWNVFNVNTPLHLDLANSANPNCLKFILYQPKCRKAKHALHYPRKTCFPRKAMSYAIKGSRVGDTMDMLLNGCDV